MLSLYPDEIIEREKRVKKLEEIDNPLSKSYIDAERSILEFDKSIYRQRNKDKFDSYWSNYILDTLTSNKEYYYSLENLQVLEPLQELTKQKISVLLNKLITEGKIKREKIAGKMRYYKGSEK